MMKITRKLRITTVLTAVLFCNHCGVIPQPIYNKLDNSTIHNKQLMKKRQHWLAQTELSHAQWLLDQQQLLSLSEKNSSTKPSRAYQRIHKQQQQVASQLLMHCQALSVDAPTRLLSQCHSLLHKLPLNDKLKLQLQNLIKPTLRPPLTNAINTPSITHIVDDGTNKKNPTAFSTDAPTPQPLPTNEVLSTSDLLLLCQQLVQKNKWSQARLQIGLLRSRSDLNATMLKKINGLEHKLQAALKQMENQAEILYQNKKIADAQRIWIDILKIDPDNQDIQNKHQRAQTVLDNIEVLRHQPDNHVAPTLSPTPNP